MEKNINICKFLFFEQLLFCFKTINKILKSVFLNVFEYEITKKPWYSGLFQGQGLSDSIVLLKNI